MRLTLRRGVACIVMISMLVLSVPFREASAFPNLTTIGLVSVPSLQQVTDVNATTTDLVALNGGVTWTHATGTDLSINGVSTATPSILANGLISFGTSSAAFTVGTTGNNGDFIIWSQTPTSVNRAAFLVNDNNGSNLFNVKVDGRIFVGNNSISQAPTYIFFREYDDKQDEPRVMINQPAAGNSPSIGYDLAGDMVFGTASVLTNHWVSEYWTMSQSGMWQPLLNNALDFGSSVSSVRNIYASGTILGGSVSSTNASTTNLFATYVTGTKSIFTGLLGWTNATGVNVSTTNLGVDNNLALSYTEGTSNIITANTLSGTIKINAGSSSSTVINNLVNAKSHVMTTFLNDPGAAVDIFTTTTNGGTIVFNSGDVAGVPVNLVNATLLFWEVINPK